MDMLPTELIESITPFIRDQQDLINWLFSYKRSKNFGYLLLILDLQRKGIFNNDWPSLVGYKPMNQEDCNLISKVSKYYREIELRFNNIPSFGECRFATSTKIDHRIRQSNCRTKTLQILFNFSIASSWLSIMTCKKITNRRSKLDWRCFETKQREAIGYFHWYFHQPDPSNEYNWI